MASEALSLEVRAESLDRLDREVAQPARAELRHEEVVEHLAVVLESLRREVWLGVQLPPLLGDLVQGLPAALEELELAEGLAARDVVLEGLGVLEPAEGLRSPARPPSRLVVADLVAAGALGDAHSRSASLAFSRARKVSSGAACGEGGGGSYIGDPSGAGRTSVRRFHASISAGSIRNRPHRRDAATSPRSTAR